MRGLLTPAQTGARRRRYTCASLAVSICVGRVCRVYDSRERVCCVRPVCDVSGDVSGDVDL